MCKVAGIQIHNGKGAVHTGRQLEYGGLLENHEVLSSLLWGDKQHSSIAWLKIGRKACFTKMGIKKETLREESQRVFMCCLLCCRGRIRTSTGQLAITQICGGQPQSSRPKTGRHYVTFVL